jgi:hypothetical protein
MDADELLATAESLYAGAPADFTTMRNSSASAAKKVGAADLAAALRSLTKPTAAAHALNRLVRAHPEALTQIAALRSRIEAAAAAGDRDALRETARERHELLARLVGDAGAAVVGSGGSLSATAADEMADALGAALADSTIADAVATGRLTAAPRTGGMTRSEVSALVAVPPPELGTDGGAEDEEEDDDTDDATEDTLTTRGGGTGRRRGAPSRRTTRGGTASAGPKRGSGPGSAERARARRELAAAEEADREAREDRRRREAERDRIAADRSAQKDEVRRRREALNRAERELEDLDDRSDALTADIRSRELEWKRAEAALRRARRAADDMETGG